MHRRRGQVLSDESQSGVSWKSDDAVGMMHGLLWQVPLVRLDPWADDRVGESYCCTETVWSGQARLWHTAPLPNATTHRADASTQHCGALCIAHRHRCRAVYCHSCCVSSSAYNACSSATGHPLILNCTVMPSSFALWLRHRRTNGAEGGGREGCQRGNKMLVNLSMKKHLTDDCW